LAPDEGTSVAWYSSNISSDSEFCCAGRDIRVDSDRCRAENDAWCTKMGGWFFFGLPDDIVRVVELGLRYAYTTHYFSKK
jgi:hypothetical protein